MKLLIDADLIVYKVGFVTENKTAEYAKTATDDYIGNLTDYFFTYLDREQGDWEVRHFLSGKESFRKEIDPEYKANREGKKKPVHAEAIRQHMIDKHLATVSKNGFEGDDVLGYLQGPDTVIVSIDKDLRMIPGYHYHMDDHTLTYVLPYEAMRNFYTQMLTGDSVDNVKGIEGIGPVNAKKLLRECSNEQQMFDVVFDQYAPNDHACDLTLGAERMLKNSKLLWIRQRNVKNPVAERLEEE